MHHDPHPEDERLAALAGGDPEVATDAELRAHVDSCDRCRPLVDDLATLRSALAELPDLGPSRRLQLLPPVREAAAPAAGGLSAWLRRAAAPALAAGAGLALVGAVGLAGLFDAGLGTVFQGTGGGQEVGGDAFDQVTSQPETVDEGSFVPAAPSGVDSSVGGLRGNADAQSPGATESDGPAAPAPLPSDGQGRSATPLAAGDDPQAPWLILLLTGSGLVGAGLVLRLVTQPRAG